MDHKTWLWRKKTSEKTIVVIDKVNLPSKENGEYTDENERALELERSIKCLNEKLSSALTESNTKDELLKQHTKVAEEAIAGWEKAEAEAVSFKQELDDALQQRETLEGRILHLDAALKECMRQLHHVREEQEQRIHNAVMKALRDLDRARINLEEMLAEANRKLAEVGANNTQMIKVLQLKEKLIKDLTERKSQAEADFNSLLGRLESAEKDNASLKYEVCMLDKELEIRNKEREFNRVASNASQKQHLESLKKITKLETECQRLRLLVRKRLPGPAALAQMKNEVEFLGRNKPDPSMVGFGARGSISNIQEAPSKRITFLTERLCAMEEENKTLKESLAKKNSELQSSRVMCVRTASKLSQVESQLGELSRGQNGLELTRSASVSHELVLSSISEEGGNEDEVSCAESWASALISELEHFRNGKPQAPSCRSVGASELSLMDDFVEMERLAIVPVDKSLESSDIHSKEDKTCMDSPSKSDPRLSVTDVTGKELVPVGDGHMDFNYDNPDIQSKYRSVEKSPSWLRDMLREILQNHVSQKSVDEILEGVQIALTSLHYPAPDKVIEARQGSSHSQTLDHSDLNCPISKEPSSTSPEDPFDEESGPYTPFKWRKNQSFSSKLNQSICKIVDLIEGISQPSRMDYGNHQIVLENDGTSRLNKDSTPFTGYIVRVFQWQSSELNTVLQRFIHACNDLLQGKANLENFAAVLSWTLDWVVNHCFSLQDVSSMKDMIKKHFNWDGSCSGSEFDVGGMISPRSEIEKCSASEENNITNEALSLHFSAWRDDTEFKLKDENRRLKDEILDMKLGKKNLEELLQSAINNNDCLKIQLQDSDKCIASIRMELTSAMESKELIEQQIENHKSTNEDLDTQLTVARVKLNEARQKFSSQEVELANRSNCCEELEAMCLELQLQLESVSNNETFKYDKDEEEKRLRTDWEISAATEKLAECQETILNLGKQLKALASPGSAALFDKVIPATATTTTTTTTTTTNHRTSLLDQLMAEDEAKAEELKSPKTKEIICTGDPQRTDTGLLYGLKVSMTRDPVKLVNSGFQASPTKSSGRLLGLNDTRKPEGKGGIGPLAIVPKRQGGGGGGFLRKLLLRRKRDTSKRKTLAITA